MLESLPTIVIVKMLILQTIIKFYSAAQVLEFLWEDCLKLSILELIDK